MPVKPMLDGVELQLVQKIAADDEEVVVQHGVPALEGDFLQDLGRRASRITLTGVMTGPEAGDDLKTWREKFRAAETVSFVADIATATKVDKVLIEEFGIRELAGRPERF
ncbi:MAG: DNA circularization N-terminal domain-containing protein, partial [Blastocatellia bacterium]